MKPRALSPEDAREWANVYLHGARAALDAAENSTGIERELHLDTARRQAAFALMLQIGAEK